MNKKILIFGVLAALILVTISFASAVTTNTQTTRKESPLFGIRTRQVIKEGLQNLRDDVKARFVGERMFFLPFQLSKNINDPHMARLMFTKTFYTQYSYGSIECSPPTHYCSVPCKLFH